MGDLSQRKTEADNPNGHVFDFGGARLIADLSGALWWPAESTLLVADLHLEKGSGYAVGGQMIPPYDSATSLARLAAVIETYAPARVVCLGDSFHDGEADKRLPAAYRATLRDLIVGREWFWVRGNHDPHPPADLGGTALMQADIAGLTLRHEATSTVRPEISGHYHPKASIRVRRHKITGRCFIFDTRRLILPAFGAYTGGLSVRTPEIKRLFNGQTQVLIIGARKLFNFPMSKVA